MCSMVDVAVVAGEHQHAGWAQQPVDLAQGSQPILMVHGSFYDVIGIDRAIASRDRLLALGYPVQWQTSPMPHSVCAEEITLIAAWLRQRLG